VLAKDIWDIRSIAGSRYDQGLLDLLDDYRTNFPELMAKGGQHDPCRNRAAGRDEPTFLTAQPRRRTAQDCFRLAWSLVHLIESAPTGHS